MFDILLNQCNLKKIHSMTDEHVKKIVQHSGECEDQLDFRKIDKDKTWA